ncbi:MAG: hypothetical protein EOO38_25260, partial [Cytophagaceae bacterium]
MSETYKKMEKQLALNVLKTLRGSNDNLARLNAAQNQAVVDMTRMVRAYDSVATQETERIQNIVTNTNKVAKETLASMVMPRVPPASDLFGENFLKQQRQILDAQQKATRAFLQSQKTGVNVLDEINRALAGPKTVSLKDLMGPSVVFQQFDYVNQSLSRIISDMARAGNQASRMADEHFAQNVAKLRDAQKLAVHYDGYLRQVADNTSRWDLMASRQQAVLDPRLPTFVTEQYVATMRDSIVPEDERENRKPVVEVIYERRETWQELDDLLGQIAPRLVKMWHGAWEVLDSPSGDCLRQSTHSARELISQILHVCAPDEMFSEEELQKAPQQRPTRKMRLFKMLGSKSAADWVDGAAGNIDKMYARLSAVSHDHDEDLGGSRESIV